MSAAGQILYNSDSIAINFDRSWNISRPKRIRRRHSIEGPSGVVKHLNFYSHYFVTVAKKLMAANEVEELLRFFEYAEDGSTFTFVRDRGLGMAIGFEGKSLKDCNDNTLTFTKSASTNANGYLDPSTGLWTWVDAANTARFPAGKFGSGILSEPASSNICGRSESLDHGDWTPTNITVAANTTESNFIDGNATGERLTITNATNSLIYSTGTGVVTDDGVSSTWLKSQSGSISSTLRLTSTTGSFNADKAITIIPAWQRFYSIYTSGGSVTGNWRLNLMNTDNGAVIYAGGAQIEPGGGKLFPTSYINSDAGGTATRAEDNLEQSSTNIIDAEPLQGSVGL